DLLTGCQFEVGRDPDPPDDRPHITVLDVAPILPQVKRDPVGSGRLDFERRSGRIWLVGLPRLADRRHVVDVQIEAQRACPRVAWLRFRIGSIPEECREVPSQTLLPDPAVGPIRLTPAGP